MLKNLNSIGKKYPECGSVKKLKIRFNRGKQGYLCKNCVFNCIDTKNGYLIL